MYRSLRAAAIGQALGSAGHQPRPRGGRYVGRKGGGGSPRSPGPEAPRVGPGEAPAWQCRFCGDGGEPREGTERGMGVLGGAPRDPGLLNLVRDMLPPHTRYHLHLLYMATINVEFPTEKTHTPALLWMGRLTPVPVPSTPEATGVQQGLSCTPSAETHCWWAKLSQLRQGLGPPRATCGQGVAALSLSWKEGAGQARGGEAPTQRQLLHPSQRRCQPAAPSPRPAASPPSPVRPGH